MNSRAAHDLGANEDLGGGALVRKVTHTRTDNKKQPECGLKHNAHTWDMCSLAPHRGGKKTVA